MFQAVVGRLEEVGGDLSNDERPGVDPRLRRAVDANVGWYEDLCALHAVPTTLDRGVWRSLGRPPPLHSDIVVVEPEVSSEQVTELVGDRVPYGCKDSFASVDLSAVGFEILFSASWIHLEAGAAPESATSTGWITIGDARELSAWNSLHETTEVLLPALLRHGHFRVLAQYADQRIVAGAVARLASGAVDVSNVFAVPGHHLDWSSLTTAIQAIFPRRPIVGYEGGPALDAAGEAGFVGVGELRVWAR
jgi:hypothetical protein